MKYLRKYDVVASHEADVEHYENKYNVCYMTVPKIVDYHKRAPVTKMVQDLINEGYANVVSGTNYRDYIEISSACPYQMSQIIDLEEVALNQKQLVEGRHNVIVWDQPLPDGWDAVEIYEMYSGKTLNFSPRGGMMWALNVPIDEFTINVAGNTASGISWGQQICDYPWGSGKPQGAFSPRHNADYEAYYNEQGFRNTPKNLTVNFGSVYSTVAQTMFCEMRTTTALTINLKGDGFWVHDVIGMFEACINLESLAINGLFQWNAIRTMHNMFDGCQNLTGIPRNNLALENQYNIVYPRYDGIRGSANCVKAFDCPKLEYLGPVLNMNAISLTGCTIDGRNQDALGSGNLFYCPLLTDVHLKNVGNNSWNFADDSTKTYIPNMSVASIEYLLNNIKDEKENGYTITFSPLHQGEISQSAIEYAEQNGWTVRWDGDGE